MDIPGSMYPLYQMVPNEHFVQVMVMKLANSQWTEVAPGGGDTPLYGLYRYVQLPRVGFFSHFGHK